MSQPNGPIGSKYLPPTGDQMRARSKRARYHRWKAQRDAAAVEELFKKLRLNPPT